MCPEVTSFNNLALNSMRPRALISISIRFSAAARRIRASARESP